MPPPNIEISDRQALSLAVVALDYCALDAPDVQTWQQAAELLRGWLAEERGPCGRWLWFRPAKGQSRGQRRPRKEAAR